MKDRALIFDIKRDCSEDGPGIRTTVFFKGCPLSCHWCQNPEGKNSRPELLFNSALCRAPTCNMPCVKACPTSCLSGKNKLFVDHERCTRCDRCFEACQYQALSPCGYWISLDELLYRVNIDEAFYKSTSGGVTLSGGEPTMQVTFIHQFLKALNKRGIHTAIETCGFFNYRRFKEQILPYLDVIYFDLKLMDENLSLRYTGQSNKLILRNFKRLIFDADIEVIPRIPLIPGITDSKNNLNNLSRFLSACAIRSASLMPYNPLWKDKIGNTHSAIKYHRRTFMSDKEIRASIARFNHAND